MKRALSIGIATVLAAGAAASATPVLHFDVNSFATQAFNASNVASPFGGVNHTGSVHFSLGGGVLAGISIQSVVAGPFVDAGFVGTLTGFTGQVNLNNGSVVGGNLTMTIATGDSYTCAISPVGSVTTFIGGGFKIEALTNSGFLNNALFGNVNVSPWFNDQGVNGLPGDFLQFNFNPSSTGAASADMDIFEVVPVPPAAWAGMATLAGLATVRGVRRSKNR